MTLQELRLFSIYLSKIDPRDTKTRIVRFAMNDFQTIMELNQKNIAYFKDIARSLLNKPIDIPTERGGFTMFNLFRVFKVDADENGEWYVEINADDEALPLLFDYRNNFFKYELWNALSLKSKNQLRMYEVLKQYEHLGRRVISIIELKGMLGIGENEYPLYSDFRRNVLEVCRTALAEHTDITYTYEGKRRGRGGKMHSLEFIITKNKDYKDKLGLDKFINLNAHTVIDAEFTETSKITAIDENEQTGNSPEYEERISFLREACNGEFSRRQIIVLYGIMHKVVPNIHRDEMKSYNYLLQKYRELELNSEKTHIKHRFGYLKTLVNAG